MTLLCYRETEVQRGDVLFKVTRLVNGGESEQRPIVDPVCSAMRPWGHSDLFIILCFEKRLSYACYI